MRGPVFLKTAAGFVLKSFELDAGSSVLSWSGDGASSGSIDLLDVTNIILPDKNGGLRIHLVMKNGTTEKLIAGSSEARQQWTHDFRSICRENWSSIEIASIASRFDFSTFFVEFCCLWFKSFHGDGSLSAFDVEKVMETISSHSAYVSVGVNAFLDHHVPRSASKSALLVPINGVFDWVCELCELGHYGIADLCQLQAVNASSLEDAIGAFHHSCSSARDGDVVRLRHLLNVREACRLSHEASIAAASGSGLLFSSLVQILKQHSAASGCMISVFLVVVALDCVQFVFTAATSASCSHGQLLAIVARLSMCSAFYSSSALGIMSLCVLDSAQTRTRTLKALSAAAEASGRTLSSALVDCLLSEMDCCVVSALMFCISLLKSASSLAELESFAQLLCHDDLVAAVDSIRGCSSNLDVLDQLALFDDCISYIQTSPTRMRLVQGRGPAAIAANSTATKCGVLLQSLTPRLEKASAEGVAMLEEHLSLWLKVQHSNYFSTFFVVNKILEHAVRNEPIPSETLSALKGLHSKAGKDSRSAPQSESVIQSVVNSFWDMGSTVFGSDADADEFVLKSSVEHEKLKRQHAAALQEIKLLRESIGVASRAASCSLDDGTMRDAADRGSLLSNSAASSTHLPPVAHPPPRLPLPSLTLPSPLSAAGNALPPAGLVGVQASPLSSAGVQRNSKDHVHLKPLALQPLAPGKNENSIWRDVREDPAVVDKELIEAMFKMNAGMKRAESTMKKSKTRILDPKRANNIMISFKRLRVDASRVAAALQLCDFGFLTDDVVAILAKIVPSDEEIARIKSYDGPVEDLGEAETLLLQLDSIPMFRSKLQLLDNMYSFDATSLQRSAEMHVHACNQLCLSPAVPKLLSVLLSHANFMNAKRGPTLTDFKMSSLSNFLDCRANGSTLNLVHYMRKAVTAADPSVTAGIDALKDIVSIINKSFVGNLFDSLRICHASLLFIETFMKQLQDDDPFLHHAKVFWEKARNEISAAQSAVSEASAASQAMSKFFGLEMKSSQAADDENIAAFAAFLHVWVAAEKEVVKLNTDTPVTVRKSTAHRHLKQKLDAFLAQSAFSVVTRDRRSNPTFSTHNTGQPVESLQ